MATPLTDVREISKLAYGFMASRALFAALELRLFGHVAAGARDVDALSAATGVPRNRLQTLVAALASVGALVREEGGLSNAPAVATYLDPAARAYFGDYYRLQIGRQIYRDMTHLDAGLAGNRAALAHAEMSGWLSDPEEARIFSDAQHAGSMGPALMLAKRLDLSGVGSLLDVAGGTGAYSIGFCRANPGLAATILDFPAVIEVARGYVRDAGLVDRITLTAGDAREIAWPGGQDVVFMSYLLSAVGGDAIAPLLQRALGVLRPGGRLIIHDFMLDETHSGPSSAALFFLSYLSANPDAVSFTSGDMARWTRAAGFVDPAAEVMIPEITMMVTATKPEDARGAEFRLTSIDRQPGSAGAV